MVEVARKRGGGGGDLARRVRVGGCALLDSVHKGGLPAATEGALLTPETTCNFVTSAKPLGDDSPRPWIKRVRVQIIRHARTHSVGKSQSCMF